MVADQIEITTVEGIQVSAYAAGQNANTGRTGVRFL
jgi:hypothetical protein